MPFYPFGRSAAPLTGTTSGSLTRRLSLNVSPAAFLAYERQVTERTAERSLDRDVRCGDDAARAFDGDIVRASTALSQGEHLLDRGDCGERLLPEKTRQV